MTVSLQVNKNGTFYPVKYLWVRQGGVWTQVRQVFANQSGTWKQSYPEVADYQLAYDSGAVHVQLHSAGDYTQGWVYSPTYSVTNGSVLQQTVTVNATFYYGSHVITNSSVFRNDGTQMYTTGSVDWNFNVVYHTTQYRTFSFTDTIQPGSTLGYYGGMATYYNGDYNYSVGGNGFYELTVNYSSYTWPDGTPYTGGIV
jgi:hypothetical protein